MMVHTDFVWITATSFWLQSNHPGLDYWTYCQTRANCISVQRQIEIFVSRWCPGAFPISAKFSAFNGIGSSWPTVGLLLNCQWYMLLHCVYGNTNQLKLAATGLRNAQENIIIASMYKCMTMLYNRFFGNRLGWLGFNLCRNGKKRCRRCSRLLFFSV